MRRRRKETFKKFSRVLIKSAKKWPGQAWVVLLLQKLEEKELKEIIQFKKS